MKMITKKNSVRPKKGSKAKPISKAKRGSKKGSKAKRGSKKGSMVKRSPKTSAKEFAIGTKRKGRDGKMYQVVSTMTGKIMWRKCKNSCAGRPRTKMLGPVF
jgi:hypothetical protein